MRTGQYGRRSRLNRSEESLRQDMRAMGLGVDDIAAELSRTYKLRPREAYRLASGLTPQKAVDCFNGYAARIEPPTIRLTIDELRDYESTPDRGSVPPLAALDLLAQVYGTDARNLVDFQDRVHMPPRERALLDNEAQVGGQPRQSLSALLIGQATAALALAFAVIYAAGDLQLGFKIWYIQDTWAPVLGGMPQALILVNAISDIIPALVAAIPVYYIYHKIYRKPLNKSDYRLRRQALVTVISATILSAITYLYLLYTGRFFFKHVVRSEWQIVLVCFLINTVVIALALSALWAVDRYSQMELARRLLGVGITAIALIPCVASVYAAFPLPTVFLCGPSFYYTDQAGRHFMVGNLIGNSGQSVYVAETRTSTNGATGHYISVVPLSEVVDETIGASAECHNLVPVSPSPPPTRGQPAASATRKT